MKRNKKRGEIRMYKRKKKEKPEKEKKKNLTLFRPLDEMEQ